MATTDKQHEEKDRLSAETPVDRTFGGDAFRVTAKSGSGPNEKNAFYRAVLYNPNNPANPANGEEDNKRKAKTAILMESAAQNLAALRTQLADIQLQIQNKEAELAQGRAKEAALEQEISTIDKDITQTEEQRDESKIIVDAEDEYKTNHAALVQAVAILKADTLQVNGKAVFQSTDQDGNVILVDENNAPLSARDQAEAQKLVDETPDSLIRNYDELAGTYENQNQVTDKAYNACNFSGKDKAPDNLKEKFEIGRKQFKISQNRLKELRDQREQKENELEATQDNNEKLAKELEQLKEQETKLKTEITQAEEVEQKLEGKSLEEQDAILTEHYGEDWHHHFSKEWGNEFVTEAHYDEALGQSVATQYNWLAPPQERNQEMNMCSAADSYGLTNSSFSHLPSLTDQFQSSTAETPAAPPIVNTLDYEGDLTPQETSLDPLKLGA